MTLKNNNKKIFKSSVEEENFFLKKHIKSLQKLNEEISKDNEKIFDSYKKISLSRSWRFISFFHSFTNKFKKLKKKIFTNKTDQKLQKKTKPELLIDVTHIYKHDHKTGIQRVVRALIGSFEELLPSEYALKTIYLENGFFYNTKNKKLINAEKGDIFLGLDFNASIVNSAFLLNYWKRHNGVKIYFVLYDLLPIHYPNWWGEDISFKHLQWAKYILEISDKIFCISETVAKDLRQFKERFDIFNEADISTFNLGYDLSNSLPTMGLPSNYKILTQEINNHNSFLMVGTLEPRKGHNDVLYVFEELWESGNDSILVIVGKKGWLIDNLVQRIKENKWLNKKLFYFNNASDEFLEKLYRSCDSLIAASYAEGFGLPIIEALSQGLSVIARDIEIFREVGKDSITYFDSSDSLSYLISNFCENSNIRQSKSDKFSIYSWQESGKEILTQILGGQLN